MTATIITPVELFEQEMLLVEQHISIAARSLVPKFGWKFASRDLAATAV